MLTQYMQYERNSTKNIYNHSYNTSYTYHIFSIEPEASALSTPKAKDKMKWCTMMAACLSDIKHLAHLHTHTTQTQKKTQTRAQQHVRAHTHNTRERVPSQRTLARQLVQGDDLVLVLLFGFLNLGVRFIKRVKEPELEKPIRRPPLRGRSFAFRMQATVASNVWPKRRNCPNMAVLPIDSVSFTLKSIALPHSQNGTGPGTKINTFKRDVLVTRNGITLIIFLSAVSASIRF